MIKVDLYNEDDVLIDTFNCDDDTEILFEVARYSREHHLEVDTYDYHYIDEEVI